jgi:disulfide bond formation protein DsbB
MINLKTKEKYSIVIFLTATITLLTAYFIQYVLGYQPCNLCLIERVPYALSLVVLIFNFKFKKSQVFNAVLLMLIFLFSILISIYHFGIEQGFINESNICKADNIDLLITRESILESFQKMNVSCKDVTIKIFGLSLTTYNIIVSLIMFLISAQIFKINNETNK